MGTGLKEGARWVTGFLAEEAIDWGRARESSGGERELVGAAGSMQQNEGSLLFVVDKDLSLRASPSTAH